MVLPTINRRNEPAAVESPTARGASAHQYKKGRREEEEQGTANIRGFAKSTVSQNARKKGCVSKASEVKLTWLVLGGDPVARSHRVEQFTAL